MRSMEIELSCWIGTSTDFHIRRGFNRCEDTDLWAEEFLLTFLVSLRHFPRSASAVVNEDRLANDYDLRPWRKCQSGIIIS